MTTKTPTKAKPGTAAELAAMFPAPKTIPVRIVRVEGEGAERRVRVEQSQATVYKLPIEQLTLAVQILEPTFSQVDGEVRIVNMLTGDPKPFYAVVAEVTGHPVEDVARFAGDDFIVVLNEILQYNADFFLHRLGLVTLRLPSVPGRENGEADGSDGDGAMPSPSSASGDARIPSASHSPPLLPQ